ncbi:hypothetical protein ABW19_dt0203280 [Dactylella cylindrospora]|nr:hypothetical protein ABW19_dt0203280 [Dactylella cylindrospora]
MSKRAAQKALYAKIIPQWPKDPLRPEADFPKFLQARLESDFGNHPIPKLEQPIIKDGSKPPIVGPVAPHADPEKQWRVLQSLLSNKYQKKYPVKKLTEPGFDPQYYQKLITELDEAPKRSWLSSYLNSWKGFIRWQD